MTLTHSDALTTWNEPDNVALRGTLVVLPGRGESPQVYERFGRRLASDAYRVHVIAAPTEAVDRAHDQLFGALDAADAQTPRIVVGSDAGAAYAAHLAAEGRLGGASALILAGLPVTSSGAPSADWDEELNLRTACSAHRARITDAGVVPAELFADLPGAWLDPATPGRIGVPTLGIHGRDDGISPLESVRRWYAAVPRAELVTIAGGRHDALNDQTHRTVAATIVLFLERLRLGSDLAPIATAELVAVRSAEAGV